ncbi:hypothetical protein BREVNS_0555 [Brevinematales bacterium NS]|jgi:hypothetical protein|nr:hypothetical protein BREVNS_0555 [Brevinematales bacterium NS]
MSQRIGQEWERSQPAESPWQKIASQILGTKEWMSEREMFAGGGRGKNNFSQKRGNKEIQWILAEDIDFSHRVGAAAGFVYGKGMAKGIIQQGQSTQKVIVDSTYRGLFVKLEVNMVTEMRVSSLNSEPTSLLGKKSRGVAFSFPFFDYSIISGGDLQIGSISFVGFSFGIFYYEHKIVKVEEVENVESYRMEEYIKNPRDIKINSRGDKDVGKRNK